VVWCPHIVTCCDCRSHWWTPGCKESWTWSRGHFSVKWMSLPLENADRKYSLERIQNGETDTDCMSSRNQGPSWDAGDTLGWCKAPGRAETLAPWSPSLWNICPHHDTLPPGCHTPVGPPGLLSPHKSLPVCLQGPHPQASQATASQSPRLRPHRATGPPPCWRAVAPPHSSYKPA
jgi:hypothetical protein